MSCGIAVRFGSLRSWNVSLDEISIGPIQIMLVVRFDLWGTGVETALSYESSFQLIIFHILKPINWRVNLSKHAKISIDFQDTAELVTCPLNTNPL